MSLLYDCSHEQLPRAAALWSSPAAGGEQRVLHALFAKLKSREHMSRALQVMGRELPHNHLSLAYWRLFAFCNPLLLVESTCNLPPFCLELCFLKRASSYLADERLGHCSISGLKCKHFADFTNIFLLFRTRRYTAQFEVALVLKTQHSVLVSALKLIEVNTVLSQIFLLNPETAITEDTIGLNEMNQS